jgi:2-iminobutanoate/2-iminopropanoate deaminase
MTDLAQFADMNAVFARRFGAHRPARSTVQVAALPTGAHVEIAAIARVQA